MKFWRTYAAEIKDPLILNLARGSLHSLPRSAPLQTYSMQQHMQYVGLSCQAVLVVVSVAKTYPFEIFVLVHQHYISTSFATY